VAIDGKTLRGARAAAGDGRPVHLLAAMDHTSRGVLAQHQVGGAPEEVPGFRPLLAGLDLAGVVVTADALQTHPEAAKFLVADKQAHYLFQVKANQPTLLARCTGLPWHRVPVLDRTRDRGHGRIEVRTLKASPSTTSASPTPPRSSRSPASAPSAAHRPALGVGGGRP
jgi:predicted transposase YbfD/YdcC